MRLIAWFPLAVLSVAAATAATHPRYGGGLRIEMREAPVSLDAAESRAPASLVLEPLVRLDPMGAPQPWLAANWQQEGTSRKWRLALRPGVKLQDGSPLTAASLTLLFPGSTANGDSLLLRADHGIEDLLLELAAQNVIPTGPFRMTAFEAGKRATFAANDDYWGGRPFLDTIEVEFGRVPRDQLADLELGKADLVELAPADMKRAADRGRTVWASSDVRLIAMVVEPGHLTDARLREALALSIDRAAMHNVLLQKQGDSSAALLPEWISGYASAFPAKPDLSRARSLAAVLPPAARNLALGYDPALPGARLLAERVAVNARDAGLTLQVVSAGQTADISLVERRIHEVTADHALTLLAASFGWDVPPARGSLQSSYEAERRLLGDFRVIPLFHLPDFYAAGARVRVYGATPLTRLGDWRFENLWLASAAP